MKNNPRMTLRIVFSLALMCLTPPLVLQGQTGSSTGATADFAKQLENLQKQVESLQAQITELKKQQAAAPAAAAPSTTAASAPAPTLASLAGPTSLPAPKNPDAITVPPAPLAAQATGGTAAPAAPAAPTLASLFGSTSITGFVDGYYNYNFNHPHNYISPVAQTGLTPLRFFDAPTNQFGLNMAELIIARPPDATASRLGYNFTLGFGNAMNVVNASDPGGVGFAQYLKEAYLSYLVPVGKGLQVDFGKFVTTNGAEVIETKDNFNYSRSLLFYYAIPYYHFGFRAKYAFSDKYSLTGLVVNGWNNIIDNNTGKTYGLSFGWNPSKKVTVTQNYYAGPEMTGTNAHWRQLVDTVVTYAPTAKLSLMANGDYGRGDEPAGFTSPVWWAGGAGYLRYAFNDKYAFAGRAEYYDDHSGFTTGTFPSQLLYEVTATFERKIGGNLITRLEFRRDMSNRQSLLKGTTPIDSQNTVSGGLIYVFDVRDSK